MLNDYSVLSPPHFLNRMLSLLASAFRGLPDVILLLAVLGPFIDRHLAKSIQSKIFESEISNQRVEYFTISNRGVFYVVN